MVPAVATTGFPATWPIDGRVGGVPDPTAVGPNMIQIGTEGGLLPAPAVLPNQPVDYVTRPPERHARQREQQDAVPRPRRARRRDRRLLAGTAGVEADPLQRRAGSGAELRRPLRLLHRRSGPDGGRRRALDAAGYGPNTRTIMQFQVEGPAAPAFDTAA